VEQAAELRQRVAEEASALDARLRHHAGPLRRRGLSTPGRRAGRLGPSGRWLEQSKDVPLAASSWSLQMKELAPDPGARTVQVG